MPGRSRNVHQRVRLWVRGVVKPPFIIYALPRSRTFWLSRFLAYGEWECGHDQLRHLRSLDDVTSWFAQPNIGTVETAAAPWWRLLRKLRPDVRTITIRRLVSEVMESLLRIFPNLNRPALLNQLRHLDRKLDQIEARIPGVLSVPYTDVASEETCQNIFEYCLPYSHDKPWYICMSEINMQVNIHGYLKYYFAHKTQLDKLGKIAKYQTIAGMRPEISSAFDGMTYQQEPFDTFFRDGQALFAEHLTAVGEAPDAVLGKNIALMRTIEAVGALQVTTARCNGRMFGYLMTVISPSLESPDIISATHTTFFATAGARGLGMKLQRCANEALKSRGVTEAAMRAGSRGNGPKMGALYRRLGAERVGEMYLLNLKAV
jgi:hypothetical protein